MYCTLLEFTTGIKLVCLPSLVDLAPNPFCFIGFTWELHVL